MLETTKNKQNSTYNNFLNQDNNKNVVALGWGRMRDEMEKKHIGRYMSSLMLWFFEVVRQC